MIINTLCVKKCKINRILNFKDLEILIVLNKKKNFTRDEIYNILSRRFRLKGVARLFIKNLKYKFGGFCLKVYCKIYGSTDSMYINEPRHILERVIKVLIEPLNKKNFENTKKGFERKEKQVQKSFWFEKAKKLTYLDFIHLYLASSCKRTKVTDTMCLIMSHRKFEHPRLGSLGFLPKSRSNSLKITNNINSKAIIIDKFPFLNLFLGFKVGMTHIIRSSGVATSRSFKVNLCEAVTVVACPPLRIIGIAGYILVNNVVRKANTLILTNKFDSRINNRIDISGQGLWLSISKCAQILEKILNNCSFVRLIAKHENIFNKSKSFYYNIFEVQVHGGSLSSQIEFSIKLLGNQIRVGSVFSENDQVAVISVSKGHGLKGVVNRWGITRLPRKTHRGLRKVACIGPWTPSRVSWTIARAGQRGFHKRTSLNLRLYKIGEYDKYNFISTTFDDLNQKSINVLGGYKKFGLIKHDYILIKGSIHGTVKRPIIIRHVHNPRVISLKNDKIDIKFIDVSSRTGRGVFQTHSEKYEYQMDRKRCKK